MHKGNHNFHSMFILGCTENVIVYVLWMTMLSILLSCNLGKKIKCLLCQPFHNCDIEYFLRPKLSDHFDFSILILKECTNFKLING